QGSIQEIHDPVAHAGNYLQAALGEDLGAVASSGDWLLAKVTKLRGELLTPTGRPTGDYKKADEALTTKQAQLADLEAQVATYQDMVDARAISQEQQREVDAAKPWAAQREQANATQKELDAIAKLQLQQDQANKYVADCETREKLLLNQLDAFDKAAQQLVE